MPAGLTMDPGGTYPQAVHGDNSRGVTVLLVRGFFRTVAGIFAGILLLYPRGVAFPHGCGYIRAVFVSVPARGRFFARLRVYSRDFSPCTRAGSLFRTAAGFSARFLLLYPRGGAFSPACGYVIRIPPRLRLGPPCYAFAGILVTFSRVFFSYYTTLFFL